MGELTESQKNELEALAGNHTAIVRVVSDLRQYRAAAKKLLSLRYRDGECDACALCDFETDVNEIAGKQH